MSAASSAWGMASRSERQRSKSAISRLSVPRARGLISSVSRSRRTAPVRGRPWARGEAVHGLQRRRPEAAPGHVDDALEGEVVARLRHDAKVGDGVADLHALVEPGAADDPVGNAEHDPGVPQTRGSGSRPAPGPPSRRGDGPWSCRASISSPTRRASSAPSQTPLTRTFSPSGTSVHRVLPRRPTLLAMRPEAAPRMWAVER